MLFTETKKSKHDFKPFFANYKYLLTLFKLINMEKLLRNLQFCKQNKRNSPFFLYKVILLNVITSNNKVFFCFIFTIYYCVKLC